jgi:hypothetical protein
MSNAVLGEFCGGEEGIDEVHTLFDGIYMRWNGYGAWDVPQDLPDDQVEVWNRERRYAKLGWMLTDIAIKAWRKVFG